MIFLPQHVRIVLPLESEDTNVKSKRAMPWERVGWEESERKF